MTFAAAVVRGPDVEVSSTNAVVRWATDVPTKARVQYGPALSSLKQSVEGPLGTEHSVTLPGLRPDSKYFYAIRTARVSLATNSFSTSARSQKDAQKVEPTSSLPSEPPHPPARAQARVGPPAGTTWGNPGSLRDHFERHGADFKAKDEDDYARQAHAFLERARTEGLPTKVDAEGTIRIFDPKTRTFGAYNRNGTTKTFFKPNSRDYFDRQPGKLVKAQTLTF